MREIKFRAWDKEYQKMIGPFDMRDFSRDRDGDCADFYIPYPEGTNQRYDEGYWMQYTGLKDKNGKEIYEGDIVRYKADNQNGRSTTYIDIIEWDNECSGYSIFFRDDYYSSGMKWKYIEPKKIRKTIEVIGNVWENPELLKEKE
jgi:uncharacterized phage protein (TIGR01671 family)